PAVPRAPPRRRRAPRARARRVRARARAARGPRRGDPRRRLHVRRARPARLPLRIHERGAVVNRLPVLVAVCAFAYAGAQAQTPAPPAITIERVRETVTWLASDEREGRDSPSRGLEAAGAWLAERFKAAGLEQAVPKSWFHDYTLPGFRLDSRNIALTV